MTGTAAAIQRYPVWAQAFQDGNHTLTPGGAYEHVTEMPTLTIPRSGRYIVQVDVRGVVIITGASSAFITAMVYKNGLPLTQTEVNPVTAAQNDPADSQKNYQSGAGTSFAHEFTEGDTVDLYARLVVDGVTAIGSGIVIANADGRGRITAWWIAPPGTTP